MASDVEIEQLRAAVSCAVVLERRGYRLDEQESSRRSLKYRRGKGETVIVNHDGHGWWDTGSTAKGDVFTLVQYLDPGLNFGQVRRELRDLVGIAPTFQPTERITRDKGEHVPPELLWTARKPVTEGSPVWNYLTRERGLPPEIVNAATRTDALRDGPYASAWFAHRDADDQVTGIEMRGPNYRGFSRDGDKTLFRLQPGHEAPTRLAVTEAPIDAMSLAVLEGMRKDTLYVGTAGGMGPRTIAALGRELTALADRPGAVMLAATDADPAGDKYAAYLTELAAAANVPAQRAVPAGHKDWNDALRATGQGQSQRAGLGTSPAVAAIVRAMDRSDSAASLPWSPAPIAMGQRVRAVAEQATLRSPSATIPLNVVAPTSGPAEPRSPPGPGPRP
jgi:hypothetical protein